MEYTVSSLQKICITLISELLLKCQKKVYVSPLDNPFSAYNPKILHELIRSICGMSMKDDEYFKCSYVYPLIITGRITSFELTFADILHKESEEILDSLKPYSEKLNTLMLSYKHLREDPNSFLTSSNLGTLLHSTKNLISLNTSITFNVLDLSHCENLTILILNFPVVGRFMFLSADEMRYKNSLRILRILNLEQNRFLQLYVANILRYCVEIIEIDYDVSRSLVYLHILQRATKYKLQKTLLGDHLYDITVSRTTIRIASRYCPDLITVEAVPTDYPAFRALKNFRNITNLTLYAPTMQLRNFNRAVRPLLENSDFGPKLKHLVLLYFSFLDFSCIGECCPELEELRVDYWSENNQTEFTPNSFQKIICLSVKNMTGTPCREDSIIALLSKTKTLEFLTIEDAGSLNDTVLEIILRNTEVFSKVKSLTIINGGLTAPGIYILAQCMIKLRTFTYTSRFLSSELIERIFLKHRPHVRRIDLKWLYSMYNLVFDDLEDEDDLEDDDLEDEDDLEDDDLEDDLDIEGDDV